MPRLGVFLNFCITAFCSCLLQDLSIQQTETNGRDEIYEPLMIVISFSDFWMYGIL